MGKATKKSEWSEYELTEREYNLLKIMKLGLEFNTLQNKIISGFLYTICYSRLGYKDGENLVFQIDLDKDDRKLEVKPLPVIEQAQQTA